MKFNRDAILERYGKHHRIRQIYLLPDHKVGYVANPKAGCSSIKAMLERIHAGEADSDIENPHTDRRIPFPDDIGWDRINQLQADGLYGFTIVRDPVERARSGFCDKIPERATRKALNAVLGRKDPLETVTFDDFITALEIQKPEEMDAHWRPQHLVLMMDQIKYDFIGRIENMAADMARVHADTGLPQVPLPHRNKRGSRKAPRYATVTPERRKRIEAIYQKDFELFGY